MSLIDDLLSDSVSASQVARNTQAGMYVSDPLGAPSASGGWQSALLGLGTNYLTARAQIDLANRYQQSNPQLMSAQAPINTDLTTRAVSGLGGIQFGNLLPFILLGLGAWVLLGRG